jgi:hypothetical protein
MQNEKASPEQFRDATATLLERWDELSGRATVFVYGSQSELDRALIHTIPGIAARPLSVANSSPSSPAPTPPGTQAPAPAAGPAPNATARA